MNNQSDSETNSKLNKLKTEFANETGIDISQYDELNKACLTSRQNGYVGGYLGGTMTKRLVEMAEQQLMGNEGKN